MQHASLQGQEGQGACLRDGPMDVSCEQNMWHAHEGIMHSSPECEGPPRRFVARHSGPLLTGLMLELPVVALDVCWSRVPPPTKSDRRC